MSGLKRKKTVVVAMSGGVDSSVAAALLLREGYDVIGITMKTYSFDHVGGNVGNETSCCGLDAFNDARRVAVKLGIPHYVVDFTGKFASEVIGNFVDEYLQGRTPNPCIICNRTIKWGALMEKAESLGATHLATGHYARLERTGGRMTLHRAKHLEKDQSYALWGIKQEALGKTMFPLGGLTKEEVREKARQLELSTAEKGESYEICFVPDNNYRRFLTEQYPDRTGEIAGGDILRGGNRVGTHRGYPFYTIGQRSGIGAFGKKMYVTSIDPAANTVTVGEPEELMKGSLVAKDINYVSVREIPDGMEVLAQVRYRDTPEKAVVSSVVEGRIRVDFNKPKRAITPGQSVVLYDGEMVLAGGVIESVGVYEQ